MYWEALIQHVELNFIYFRHFGAILVYNVLIKRKVLLQSFSGKFLRHVGVRDRAANGFNHDTSDQVGVNVGGWASVLKVSETLLGNRSGNTDGGTTVSNTRRETFDAGGLMTTGQSLIVIGTIQEHVLLVSLGQLFQSSLDMLHTTRNTHGLGADVSMATSTVPVTSLQGLGVERDLDTEFLSNSRQKVSSHPQLITHVDTLAGTDLELPLGRHDLGVDTRNLDAGVETGAVVGLDDVTGVDLTGTDTAVVGALRGGVTTLGPCVDLIELVEQGVFLFQTEPDLLVSVGLHQLDGLVAVVELVGGTIVVPALSQDNDVVTLTEGVRIEGNGSEIDIGVVAGGLTGGRSIKVPLRKIINGLRSFGEGFAL